MEPNQDNIIRTLGLLKKANCEDYVPLAELARELKVSKTALMAHIEDNPSLFVVGSKKPIKGKNPGLLVVAAFKGPEDNYTRPEFLARLQEKNRKTIHVSEYGCYGQVFGYYIAEDYKFTSSDDADHRKNYHLWRNTAEKLARLHAAGHARKGYFWDCTEGRTQIWYDHVVTVSDLRALVAEGWKLTGELPKL